MTTLGDIKFALYIHVKESLAPGVSCKGILSSIKIDNIT